MFDTETFTLYTITKKIYVTFFYHFFHRVQLFSIPVNESLKYLLLFVKMLLHLPTVYIY